MISPCSSQSYIDLNSSIESHVFGFFCAVSMATFSSPNIHISLAAVRKLDIVDRFAVSASTDISLISFLRESRHLTQMISHSIIFLATAS